MKREDADKLYDENWDREYTTDEALYARIKALAENGSYSCCVYFDSMEQYHCVKGELRGYGYEVEDYNGGGGSSILQISWG